MLEKENITNIKLLGHLSGEVLTNTVKKSYFCVVPSEYYENNPFSIIESFASGVPVIGARIGGIPELVHDNETGLLFEPCNADDLREKISRLWNSPALVEKMRKNVKQFIGKEYNPELHYKSIISIYKDAIA